MTDTDNLTRRRFLKATGGAATAAALAGCTGGGNGDGGGNGNGGNSGNKLQLINPTMTTLDPVKATDTASGTVIQQIFDPLMNYPNGQVSVENLLVKEHTVSDDKTTYTFKLKEGVKFHNGKEVTAKDVVYSWRRLAESTNSRRAYFILDSIGVKHDSTTKTYKDSDGEKHELTVAKPNSLALKTTGDYELEMTLQKPFHSTLEMLAYTSFAVIPEGIVGDINGYNGEMKHSKFATKNPVGAGPFKFKSWKSDDHAEVTKYEDYHDEKAKVDGVHWKILSEPNARHTYGITNKRADIVYESSLPTAQYDPNKVKNTSTDDQGRIVGEYGPTNSDATMNYLGVSTISSYYMGFNTEAVPKAVRQACAYAMNQETLVKEVFKGRGESAYHFTPPMIYPGGAKQYKSHAESKYPYGFNESQLDKAKQVMKDAGYGPNNPFKFEFTVYQSSTTWPKVGKLLRDKLKSAHIEMSVNSAPFNTLLSRGRKGNLEAYSLGWIMDWPAPDNFLGLLYPPLTDTSKSSPQAYTNWSGTKASKQATKAWEKIQNNRGPTKKEEQAREQAYVTMEEANWEDVTFLPTYHLLSERFSYDWVDVPKYGGAGFSRQMYNNVTLSERKK
ncbi:ABC transporter substrate-binding protein [Haladaptatus caseinilyticus]|uniref:ABC transporter substrate-binding protein n=1 Tax=Haladaptatus caseinilyticus TaxID=2993314 RepID=UPI00224B322B|nr:ABC transporter substrate-binding protein [Haladaptatus caseinilyticus]